MAEEKHLGLEERKCHSDRLNPDKRNLPSTDQKETLVLKDVLSPHSDLNWIWKGTEPDLFDLKPSWPLLIVCRMGIYIQLSLCT